MLVIGCPCVTVSHALSALRSLQANRCQQSCTPGFYHDGEEGACKPCDRACATCAGERPGPQTLDTPLWRHPVRFNPRSASAGAGSEACNRCAEGYLMQEWRCVASCSAGFFATQSNPEIADGLRVCRR